MKHLKYKITQVAKKEKQTENGKLLKSMIYDLLNLCAPYGKDGMTFKIVFYSPEIEWLNLVCKLISHWISFLYVCCQMCHISQLL